MAFVWRQCLLVLLLLSFSTSILAQSTCSASSPCAQGCCSKFGNCGFGPDFCSAANCVGTCNATSECGQYAPSGKSLCPLNVCCSQYGFCGTTADFCGTGCQNGCTKVTRPSCGGASSDTRTIGYYESWSYNRTCDSWAPENINANLWTHINYAFAVIDSSNKIAAMNPFDVQLYPRVTALKRYNPNLKVFISVGGWAAGGKPFSSMVSTANGQLTFITSLMSFMQTYGFDGIDIDWEYPVAPDRDGAAADFANFVSFLRLLKFRTGTKYGVTLTLPSSYWYLRGFDIVNLSNYVDWFNFMSYDIHGTWDGNSPYTQAVVNPHTNLTEIQNGLDLLWRNNISPSKVVLGLGFYGRSFTLKNPSCKTPGCPFLSGGKPGTCTGTSGILSNAEIQRIITSKSLTPTLDTAAAIKYITWDNDQWVSYDDAQTLAMKKTFANNQCLGGTMVWALDQDDPNGAPSQRNLALEGLRSQGDNIDINPWRAYSKASTISYENALQLLVFWTDCQKDPSCPAGFTMLTKGHGKVFDVDEDTITGDGCHGGWGGHNRALCIETNVYFSGTCNWYGKAGSCNEGCPAGSLLLSSNSHVGPNSCNHNRYKNFCCTGFVEADSVQACPGTYANNAFAGGLAKRGLSDIVGTKAECDGLTQGLAAVAGLSLVAASTYVFLQLPGIWRYSIGRGWFWDPIRNLMYPNAGGPPVCTSTTTEQVDKTTFTNNPHTTGCDYNLYPQACGHYLSIIRRYPQYQTLICPVQARKYRNAPAKWDSQHSDTSWRQWIDHMPGVPLNSPNDRCNRDEYPPLRFVPLGLQPNPITQWVRFLPATQNQAAGQLWQSVCTTKVDTTTNVGPVNNNVCTNTETVVTTVNAFVLTAINQPNPMNDDLLSDNICVPTSVTNDMGYALFTKDPWYNQVRNQNNLNGAPYQNPVPANLIGGRTPPRGGPNDQLAKRWLHEDYDGSDPANIIVDDGNSTRPATEDELFDKHGLLKCKTPGCQDETIDGHNIEVVNEPETPEMEIPEMIVTATATATSRVLRVRNTGARLSSGPMPTAPAITNAAEMHLKRHQHGHHHRDS